VAERAYIEEVEQQAALFALGASPSDEAEAFRLRLASGCPFCQAEVDDCKRVLSLLPLSVRPVTPPLDLRARLLKSVQEQAEQTPPTSDMSLLRSDETPWQPTPYPGVTMRLLYKHKTMLVRMGANAQIPAHSHATAEQCLVLEGSVRSAGVTANAGDFIYMPAGSKHQDLNSSDGALLLITYA